MPEVSSRSQEALPDTLEAAEIATTGQPLNLVFSSVDLSRFVICIQTEVEINSLMPLNLLQTFTVPSPRSSGAALEEPRPPCSGPRPSWSR